MQIQQVAQVDLVDRFEDFISGTDAGTDITTGYILGADQATSVYESAQLEQLFQYDIPLKIVLQTLRHSKEMQMAAQMKFPSL